ncbi:glycerol-3-phosphate acyltransferase 3-like [Penaeus vannamei]|uniref:glycerol-3-phosphate acyltransferase 3-like n=1 Tax=Penaeus vannamei TaxID=6689 RepID=UPI000F68CF46|nr:glycerol-3-phosphate acyltransferase 3-like [Penaeus vannamei]XP_027220638.1 glycerol-3-phosphate acyltransferase 3-like [Penaeus vannamei]
MSYPSVLEPYAGLISTIGLWEDAVPYVVWGHVLVFVCLLVVASVGRRLKLRRKYVDILDGVFQFVAARTEEPGLDQEDEEDFDDEGLVICPESPRADPSLHPGTFELHDTLPYLTAGMRAVVQDCVSKSFTSAELRTWNMLSRTKQRRHLRMSPSMTAFWAAGVVVRYGFLLPMRVLVLALSLATLVVLCSGVGLLPDTPLKKRVNAWVVSWCFDFVAGAISVVARFHNKENRPNYGIAVANHTSPIDSMVLATDQCYDMVGQKARGILGVFMTALSRSSTHIWFERGSTKERAEAAARLQAHASNHNLPPILIYPEGTCVNNTAVMQFKKGAFEIDSVIYPIAIRFDPRYGDPFWYQDTFGQYILSMMTSWAIVCDVWYLPPTRRGPRESGAAFASRVKGLIAHKGGFVELAWDGFVKLQTTKNEAWEKKQNTWKQMQQREYAKHLNKDEEKEE